MEKKKSQTPVRGKAASRIRTATRDASLKKRYPVSFIVERRIRSADKQRSATVYKRRGGGALSFSAKKEINEKDKNKFLNAIQSHKVPDKVRYTLSDRVSVAPLDDNTKKKDSTFPDKILHKSSSFKVLKDKEVSSKEEQFSRKPRSKLNRNSEKVKKNFGIRSFFREVDMSAVSYGSQSKKSSDDLYERVVPVSTISATSRKKFSRQIFLPKSGISIADLSKKMAEKKDSILEYITRGGFVQDPDYETILSSDIANIVVNHFGHRVKKDEPIEDFYSASDALSDKGKVKPPVVTVVGHVDHGKTTLLDALRNTNKAEEEPGLITQNINVSEIKWKNGESITFIDTPGHGLFERIRERGMSFADIILLIVAIDDNLQEQTISILKSLRGNTSVIVCITKCDKKDIDVPKQTNVLLGQISSYGIVAESMGGNTQVYHVSSRTQQGLDDLIEGILLQANLLDLRASFDSLPSGFVVDSSISQRQGVLNHLIIRNGCIKKGSILICSEQICRVRLIKLFGDKIVDIAYPSSCVTVLGFSESLLLGSYFQGVDNLANAKKIIRRSISQNEEDKLTSIKTVSSSGDFSGIVLRFIIKAETDILAESLSSSLSSLSADDYKFDIISFRSGDVTESDIQEAAVSDAIIIVFGTLISKKNENAAFKKEVKIWSYNVLYDLIDKLSEYLSDIIPPIVEDSILGHASVCKIFSTNRDIIVGCAMLDGQVKNNSNARITREGRLIKEAKILSLKRFSDEVSVVKSRQEFGLSLQACQNLQVDDKIEFYEVITTKRKISLLK